MVCLGNRDHSVVFETATKYCILDYSVDYESYSISSRWFLPTVVDIMVIWNVSVCSCHLLFDHLQFTLIQGPNIPGSYAILFSQHRTLLSPPDTSTTGHCFHFGMASSFLLELFLCSSAVAYLVPTSLRGSSFSVISFCLFILFMGFSRQEYLSGLPFASPVDHILSELSTMTHLSWMALHSMAHSFIELDKTVTQVISLDSFLWLWFHSVCPLMVESKRLVEASWWEGLAMWKNGSCFGGWGHTQ